MQMIQYTKAGDGLRLGLLVHHTDADREYAYDRKSHVGTLDKVLDYESWGFTHTWFPLMTTSPT